MLICKATRVIREDCNQRQEITIEDALLVVEKCTKTIHEKYIHTYHGPEDQRPTLDLLLAIIAPQFFELIKTEGLATETVDNYAVVGSGGPLVESIVETLGGARGVLEQDKIVSIYALHQAKEYDAWSGKQTSVKVLRSDRSVEPLAATRYATPRLTSMSSFQQHRCS